MNATTIDYLSAVDARAATLDQLRKAPVALRHRSMARFAARYAQPDYGWTIAARFADRRVKFPLLLKARDSWVYRAYLSLLDARVRDPVVEEAMFLALRGYDAPIRKAAIEGMLLAACAAPIPEALREVAQRTGIDLRVLEAYEVLFFNVLDRAQEHAYVGALVYPQSRAVELQEDYHRTVTHAHLIRRLGYNKRNMALTAYIAGLGDRTPLTKLAARENSEIELTNNFMATGLLLASSNLLNQRSPGLSRATTLAAASRSAGPQVVRPSITNIGDLIQDEIRQASTHAVEAQNLARLRAYTAEPIDAEGSVLQ